MRAPPATPWDALAAAIAVVATPRTHASNELFIDEAHELGTTVTHQNTGDTRPCLGGASLRKERRGRQNMSIWKLRLGLNPFTLLALTLTGLVLVVSYFYLLSFFLSDASPDQGPGARRRHLLWGRCMRLTCLTCAAVPA